MATVKQKASLSCDSLGSTGYRYYRSLSQQNHNGADSPTVTPGMEYPTANVTEASHWLTGGLRYMRVFFPDICTQCVLLRKPGAAVCPLS